MTNFWAGENLKPTKIKDHLYNLFERAVINFQCQHVSKNLQWLFRLFESGKKKHDSAEEKEKVQKKTIFENDRLKIIVFYDDTDWQFEICCLTFPLLSLD